MGLGGGGSSSDHPRHAPGHIDIWGLGGLGVSPRFSAAGAKFLGFCSSFDNKTQGGVLQCAPYTHAHCTSKTRARFSSVAFATYLRSVGAAPARSLRGRHWGVPKPKGVTTVRRPQARLLGVCACFVVKKGRAFCIECIALCSLDAPETRNLSCWLGRVPNEAAPLCSMFALKHAVVAYGSSTHPFTSIHERL